MANLIDISDKKKYAEIPNPNLGYGKTQLKNLETGEELIVQEHKDGALYYSWVQQNLDKKMANAMIDLALKNKNAVAILQFFITEMGTNNALVMSQQAIADVLGVTRQTVSTAIKLLEKRNFIQIYKSGGANVYAVNHDLFWKTSRHNITKSKFMSTDATIIFSEKEYLKNVEKNTLKMVDNKEK